MRQSIRIKLLFYMTISILIFMVVLFCFNLLFTRELYINHKKSVLLEAGRDIENILSDGSYNDYFLTEFELNRLERSIGAAIFISKIDGELYYPAPRSFGGVPDITPFFPFDSRFITGTEIEKADDEISFFMTMKDPNLGFDTLRFQTKLGDGTNILIWLPMDEISQNINVFNKIVVIAACIVLLGSVFWSSLISAKFTKPITQMNRTARKISMQDFSEKIDITGNDEIAQLAASINEISHRLSDSIEQLNNRNLQLEEDIINEKKLDKMRKEFISGVSHELKTPLFLIQGYAEGLRNVIHIEEKRSFYCDVIMSETEKMDKLIKDLLDLSQIESGVFAVKEQIFDIVDLLTNILYKFRPLLENKEIDLKIDFPDKLTVNADPIRTEQIIVNYLNNAIDHLDNEKLIKITVVSNTDNARISVFNSGKNIPDDLADKIWLPFFKADDSRTREYGGTGLGLSIVKAIQEGHKNGYGVENVTGGVEFWIKLNLETA